MDMDLVDAPHINDDSFDSYSDSRPESSNRHLQEENEDVVADSPDAGIIDKKKMTVNPSELRISGGI